MTDLRRPLICSPETHDKSREHTIANRLLFITRFHDVTAPSGPAPPHYRCFTITLKHTTLGRTPLDEWSARTQRPLLDNTQHSDIHVPGGIRTRHPRKIAASDWRLTRRGHWDRLFTYLFFFFLDDTAVQRGHSPTWWTSRSQLCCVTSLFSFTCRAITRYKKKKKPAKRRYFHSTAPPSRCVAVLKTQNWNHKVCFFFNGDTPRL
jgi:hypothetical protein